MFSEEMLLLKPCCDLRFFVDRILRFVRFPAILALVCLLAFDGFPSENGIPNAGLLRLKFGAVRTSALPSGQSIKSASPDERPGYYIVQRSERVNRRWREEVAAFSHRVVGYLPEDALVVKASPQEVSRLLQLEGVRWVGQYLPQYKISPSLGSLAELRHAEVLSPGETCPLLVSVFPGSDVRQVGFVIEEAGCKVESLFPGHRRSYLKVRAPKRRIPSIAQIEDVEWIERFRPFVFAGVGRTEPLTAEPDVQVQIIRAPEVWERGLTGKGQVVAICDTGLDVGVNGTPMHDDFEGRIDAAYALGRPGLWNDPHGHGTHVAGTAVGNGMMSDGEFRAAAYESRLVFQSGYVSDEDPLGGIPVNLCDLFKQVYLESSARVHSNSWGSPDKGLYSLFSAQTDEFVWDNKDFLIVFAAGNDGVDVDGDGVIDPDSLYSPATAKNCIAVGASENVRESGGLSTYTWGVLGYLDNRWFADPIAGDYVSDNENGMAAFSSRGPCLDGRIKPDLIAPGTDIISCRSQDPLGKQSTADLSWGVYDDYYVYMGGTSMAAPAVASCAAVVRQFYAEVKGIANPSAALIKATLINGAADMCPGQYGTGPEQEIPPAPNNVEGWGRVDLKQSLFPDEPAELRFVDETAGLETDQSAIYEYVVGSSEAPFRATMAYSDYPASPAAAIALVNNLDMTVTTPDGETVYPNGGDAPDELNNVEAVNLLTPSPGIYSVHISATNVPQGPQPYALVVMCGKATGQAAISLNKRAYGQRDSTMTVTLMDADLTASSSPSVKVTSDSDPAGVAVILSPTLLSASVFQGRIGLDASSRAGGEPTLNVSHGDTISVTHLDRDYGGAGSREVLASATVDLVPPEISDVSASEVTDDSAVITWSCSEGTTGSVSYGVSRLLGSSVVDRTNMESHSVALRGLSENRTYYFSIRAQDPAGNQASDDNHGSLYVFHTRYTVFSFRDDMEMGEGAWTHYGDVDQWEYGSPTFEGGPPSAHSGDFCWGTRLAGYLEHDDLMLFGDIRHEYLVSPELSVGPSAKLTFWHWHDLLFDWVFGIYDYAYVEISADGGDWQNVTPNPDGAYTGFSPSWIEEEIDLSAFAGQMVQMRFQVEAEPWFDYLGPDYQYAGWYIDDVVVSSTRAYGEPTITLNKLYATTAVPLQAMLIDGDLNMDTDRAEVATVAAWSTTESNPETILLIETGANTGVFSGNIFLAAGSPVHGDGKIQVREGDIVSVSYQDVQGGILSPGATVEASATVDLTAPTIADLAVATPAVDRAVVSFTTEPTAVAEIIYSTPGGQEQSQISRRRSVNREFVLRSLAENTLYRFRISVTDEAGNIETYSSPGQQFSFGTKAEVVVASNSFDGASSAWDFSADEVWEVGSPTFGPPGAHSPPNCWGTDLDSFYPINCDASLTSGWVTLPEDPQLRFWHWYSIDELGWEGAYGVVEVSTDDVDWVSATAESWYAGASNAWIPESVDLSAWAGETVKVRFRLWSEESDIVIYYYAGWYVDDIAICDLVSYGRGTLVFDRPAYSLNVPVVVTLIDAHLNTDPFSRETCFIILSSSLETITVQLTETDVSSGRFIGQVRLKQGPPVAGDEYLQVAISDSIVARYRDLDNGAGGSADVRATVPLDTTAPLISDVNVSQVTDTSALVTWATDVEAIGSLSYGESPSGPFDRTLTESSYSRQHSIGMTGLSENVIYYFKVFSTDQAENVAVDDRGGLCHEIRTMVRSDLFRDGFDREDFGWMHEGLGDVWEWGVPRYGVTSAHSSPDCWATNLTGTYPGQIDASLISPPISVKDGSRLSFWHWYSINEYLLDEGEGIVEIKAGQNQWEPLGGTTYSGAIKSWEEQQFDLSSFGEQTVNVRFRLRADQWIDFFYPGWYIDDVTVFCLRPFGFGVVQLDRQVYSIPGPVGITLKDGHLNPDVGAVDTAEVTIESTSDPSGKVVQLKETGENTGVFVGEVRLRHVTDTGNVGLAVRYGDTITVHYRDADNALGETNVETSASAKVWSPPAEAIVPVISYSSAEVPATVTLTWPYEQGRAYRLYYCDDLVAGSPTWQRAPGTPVLDGASFLNYTEPVSPLSRKRFYRIEVW